MTYTYAQPTIPSTRAWRGPGLRNVVLIVALAVIFSPLGLIALAAV